MAQVQDEFTYIHKNIATGEARTGNYPQLIKPEPPAAPTPPPIIPVQLSPAPVSSTANPEKVPESRVVRWFGRFYGALTSSTFDSNLPASPASHPAKLSVNITTPPPTAPLEESSETVQPHTLQSLLMGEKKAEVALLQRYNCDPYTVSALGLSINAFFEKGYSLSEVCLLFPSFSQLLSVGMNKHHFLNGRWSIKELSGIFQIPLNALAAPNCFNLQPQELVAAKFTPADIASIGLTATQLIKGTPQFAPVNYLWWYQLRCTPQEFAKDLRGTAEDLESMKLSDDQKRSLDKWGWDFATIQVIPGIDDVKGALKVWPLKW